MKWFGSQSDSCSPVVPPSTLVAASLVLTDGTFFMCRRAQSPWKSWSTLPEHWYSSVREGRSNLWSCSSNNTTKAAWESYSPKPNFSPGFCPKTIDRQVFTGNPTNWLWVMFRIIKRALNCVNHDYQGWITWMTNLDSRDVEIKMIILVDALVLY